MKVADHDGVWAVGDCACIPNSRTGKPHPPTAQHALREGKVLAHNLLATIDGKPMKKFTFRTLGQLASLGRRTGVANVFGINFSGFIAWWMWRTIYLSRLPRFEKKLRVALDWTLDLFFSKDLVQFKAVERRGAMQNISSDPIAREVPAQNVNIHSRTARQSSEVIHAA